MKINLHNILIKNFYCFLVFVIFFIYFCYFLRSFDISYINNYAYQELFLNYEGGFVRRGLIGAIFYKINKLTNIHPQIFFPSLMIIVHTLSVIFFFYILKRYKNFNLLNVILVFSPALLLFPIYDFNMFFIKDIFVKFTILLHGFLVIKFSSDKLLYETILKYLVIPFLSFVSIFIHEYQLFFFSVHFLLSTIILKKKNIYKIYLIYFFVSFLTIFLFSGDKYILNQINNSLSNFNVVIHPQLAGGFKAHFGGWYKWHFFYFSYKDFFMFFMSFILSIFLFFFIFQYFIDKKALNINSKSNYSYLLYFLPCIGIFTAIDHGRNLSLLSTHLIIFYLVLDYNYKIFEKLYNAFYKKTPRIYLLIIFVFFYIFLWVLPQDAGFGGKEQINTIFKGSLFSEFKEFIKYLYFFIDQNITDLPEIKL